MCVCVTQLGGYTAPLSGQLPPVFEQRVLECSQVFKCAQKDRACACRSISVPASKPADVFKRLNSELMITTTELFMFRCSPLPAAKICMSGHYAAFRARHCVCVCVCVCVCTRIRQWIVEAFVPFYVFTSIIINQHCCVVCVMCKCAAPGKSKSKSRRVQRSNQHWRMQKLQHRGRASAKTSNLDK